MNPQYPLLSIDIIKDINKIPTAQIVLLDGDAAQQKFEISNTSFFEPGQKIEIQLRYEGELSSSNATVFIGLVVKHSIQTTTQKSILTIYLKDAAIKLTQQRKNKIFRKKDDIAIIKEIVSAVNKQSITKDLKSGTFAPKQTVVTHPEMVQFYCSDWDFILSRSEANGLLVLVDDGVMNVQSPDALIKGKKTQLEYGIDEIYELEAEADIREQFQSIQAIAWDEKKQALTKPQAGKPYKLSQSNLDPDTLGKIVGADQCQLVSGSELDPKEMKAWASAQMVKHRLSMMQGRIRIPGRADLKLGDVLTLKKLGKRFNGDTLITGIRHQVTKGGWQTDIQFGASATPFALSDDIVESPASGLLPAVNGLQIGVVDKYANDPEGKLRIQVKVPRLTVTTAKSPSAKSDDGLIWARLAVLDAGLAADGSQGRGTAFWPEPGDEVVLGFLNDDPRQAIILGSLYGNKHKSPLPVTDKNNEKGIFTKANLKLLFNDEDKSIMLETPDANQIVLSNKDEGIQIVDQNKNTVVMSSKGIQLISSKDITIKADGNITLEGNKVDVK
ncbi:type VI secretion system tip protein VgrG [Acaryochloris sp. IP29b_bin.148]|uniref:type VI secretion system tip protein VgrG n=1 Tax=Acaryochloris sp. IP29b_bin.148 TaxID=2969218 RepID=UPI0026392848|nr:type VI secretion system tip protein VgrG [Acaryochloris sp. IP29b_bin.148]